MSNINKIKELNNNFKENLDTSEHFEHTKGLLKDFGNYLNKHKQMFYVLMGVTAMNIAAQVVTPVSNMMSKTEISQSYMNDDGFDISKDLMNFKKEVDMSKNVYNSTLLKHQSAQVMNETVIKDFLKMKEGESIFVKNPFWEKSVFEMKIDNNIESHMISTNYHNSKKHQIDEFNSHMIVDTTAPSVSFNMRDMDMYLKNVAGSTTEQEKLDLTKFVLYHEAAHATRRQSDHLDADHIHTSNTLKGEIQSDVAALMLIGHETKDLNRFNKTIDTIIETRMTVLEFDTDHNTTYALIELKNAVNKNPELLSMKSENIAEFSYMLSEKLSSENFNNEKVIKDMFAVMPKTKDALVQAAKDGQNMDYMVYYSGKPYSKGLYGFNLKRFLEPGYEHRIDTLFDKVEEYMNKDATHEDFVALTFLKAKKDFDFEKNSVDDFFKTVHSELNKKAESNPVITNNMITMLKTKIKMDEMDYNVADIQNLVNQVNNHKSVSKNNIKFEI